MTTLGDLAWQCRLTPLNLPFFREVDSIFLDYHWLAEWPGDDAQILRFMNEEANKKNLIVRRNQSTSYSRKKIPSDIGVGIDVFGRGMPTSPGGFGLWRSLDCFTSRLSERKPSTGSAISLFAPSWTWVALKSGGSKDWEAWQRNEIYFWTGEDQKGLPEAAKRERKRLFDEKEEREQGRQPKLRWPEYIIDTEHHAIAEYVPSKPPRCTSIFLTTFGQASSSSSFRLEGQAVFNGPFTDWHFAFPQPDLIYPQTSLDPVSIPMTNLDHNVPQCEANISSEDAWLGGHCLRLKLKGLLSSHEYNLPIMTTDIDSTMTVDVTIVWKVVTGDCELKMATPSHTSEIIYTSEVDTNGWRKTTTRIKASEQVHLE